MKKELKDIYLEDRSLRLTELYALLLFSNEFTPKRILCKTENENTYLKMSGLLGDLFSVPLNTDMKEKSKYYVIDVVNEADCGMIFDFYGHDQREVSLRINRAFVDTDDEMRAFLRGAFLSCGSVSNPEKMYHLEFNVQKKNLANDLCRIINEISVSGISVKMKQRNGAYMVYLKNSDQITDFLTFTGAVNAAMTMIGYKALKDVRNKANRQANSEFHNLQKQAGAAAVQLKAIKKLKQSGTLSTLPEDLRTIAKIRLENPDMSLREIGEMLDPPLSRSGVNHRLDKLIKLSTQEN